jgi:hypothetical protein
MTLASLVVLYGVLMPPPEYDRPFEGTLVIEYLKPDAVSERCQGHPSLRPGQLVSSCASLRDGLCHVILPLDTGIYPKKKIEYLALHEIAHCNGWEPHVRHTDR